MRMSTRPVQRRGGFAVPPHVTRHLLDGWWVTFDKANRPLQMFRGSR